MATEITLTEPYHQRHCENGKSGAIRLLQDQRPSNNPNGTGRLIILAMDVTAAGQLEEIPYKLFVPPVLLVRKGF